MTRRHRGSSRSGATMTHDAASIAFSFEASVSRRSKPRSRPPSRHWRSSVRSTRSASTRQRRSSPARVIGCSRPQPAATWPAPSPLRATSNSRPATCRTSKPRAPSPREDHPSRDAEPDVVVLASRIHERLVPRFEKVPMSLAFQLWGPHAVVGASGGCSSTRGRYSTSWIRPSKVRWSIMSRATSG
jgi:hypothetical protein